MSHSKRLDLLRDRLELPLLVTKAANLRYLTGFAGSNGYLVVGPERVIFLTDGRYGEIAAELIAGLTDTELRVYTGALSDALAGAMEGFDVVTVEDDAITWSVVRAVSDKADARLEPGSGIVEELRRVKDDDEVDSLRQAARAGDEAFAAVPRLRESAATELELAWVLIEEMRRAGGEMAGWDPIVAAGAHSSRPHHLTGDGDLSSDLLLLDYGCVVDGYHSDMSRTLWLGESDPGEDLTHLYDAVAAAQEAAIETVAPGVEAKAVDEAARAVLRTEGLEEHFLHSTGHGIGLEIHEEPWVAARSTHTLAPGNVITVEPGAYVAGIGGVRIEDMVLVTDDGHEVLTHAPKVFVA